MAGKKPRAVDLFSGCGGLTTGLKQAGFEVVAAVEFERRALATYKLNHADVPHVYGVDIRTLGGAQLLQDLNLEHGELELLAGCPPCQGFSRMRTRNGPEACEDEKNDLVYEYGRLVEALLPRALLLENVPALKTDARYSQLRQQLSRLGYRIADGIHDAAHFGVPQRRRRLIMLALRGGGRLRLPPVLRSDARRTVRDAIAHLPAPGNTGDPAHDVVENRSDRIQKIIAMIPHDGGSRRDLGPQHQLACHRRCDGFGDVYGRMRWDAVSPTITGGVVNPSKGRFLHPEQDRCVTPREAALLQSFPADYQFPNNIGKFPLAQLIGNALPPELARQHGLAVMAALEA